MLRHRPIGWSCLNEERVTATPLVAFERARDALAAMGVATVGSDSAEYRVVVAGPTAPAGRGRAEMETARLYLEVRFEAGAEPGTTAVHIAPGLSFAPAGLSERDRHELYVQADALAKDFAARAGLPFKGCF